MRITMLMPKLPPAVCGIADHSLMLGKALEDLDVKVRLLAPRSGANASAESQERLWDGSAKGLRAVIRSDGADVLWVQYSGYGFSSKGVPMGLARAVEGIAGRESGTTIVACMHETHAGTSGLGWRAPIMQPLQIAAARRIVRAADIVFATVDENLERCIHEYGASRDAVELLPISANLPEIRVTAAERDAFREGLRLQKKARIAVIFGLWSSQLRSIALFKADLQSALRAGHIDHVVAVGGEAAPHRMSAMLGRAKELGGRMSVLGPAPAADVARILRCCDIGLVPTPPAYLRKSGVAAAFAAADLEVWLKTGCGGAVMRTNVEAFPAWSQIAALALETIEARLENAHYAVR